MRRAIGPWRAMANGVLCLAILGLAGAGIYLVAARHWMVQETFDVRASFGSVSGLQPGARVRVQGIDAGVVEAIVAPAEPGQPVGLVMRLDTGLKSLVRSDATARITTQGVVGARVIEIEPGTPDAAPLPRGGSIRAEDPVELVDLLNEARKSLERADRLAAAAEQGIGEINAIAGSIRRGEGTLGRLVRDDEAYERLVRLTNRGEDAIGDLNENLDALKHTWPISRYFDGRAYYDRERVLYKPGSRRESRVLAAEALFERDRAILTPDGRRLLDEAATWFKDNLQRESEVVIAAYSDRPEEPDLAHLLTQEQADAVRRYLVDQHGLGSVGWFKSRKVAAIGFGSETPQEPPPGETAGPPRRVELILFTPQA